MPNLTDLPLQLTYRTGRDDLVRGFFVPCLEAAVLYRRAAGGLISVGTSAGLALAARGAASLALRRGRMRLIVSPHLEPDDCAALERARDTPAAVLRANRLHRPAASSWNAAATPTNPPPGSDPNQVREPGPGATLTPPAGLELRPYQKDAIRAWSKAGVFGMARRPALLPASAGAAWA